MIQPTEPQKTHFIRKEYILNDDSMFEILRVYSLIKKDYPKITDNDIKIYHDHFNVDEYWMFFFIEEVNEDYDAELEAYIKDMRIYEEALNEAKHKVQQRLSSKRNMKQKTQAAFLASKELKKKSENTIVEVDNKKYKVILVSNKPNDSIVVLDNKEYEVILIEE
jgi:hypothetical protein